MALVLVLALSTCVPFAQALPQRTTLEYEKEVYEFIQDNVLYSHGVNWGGKNGAINKALTERMSCAIGHSHSFGGVQYSANSRDTVFGINVGCGS